MNREILRLSIPNIISNLSVPLLGSVDTILMGKQDDPTYLGAIALGGIIFNVIYWCMGFLRMGTTGITAQAFGRQDDREISHTLGRALIVGLGISLVLLICQFLLVDVSMLLLNGSSEVEQLGKEYFLVRIWAAPATLGLMALMGWFFGMQNAYIPMVLTIIINIVNIGLSYVFVYHYGMKAEGVALGTVLAQYVGFGLAIIFLVVKYRNYLKNMVFKALIEAESLKHFFLVNRDIFIRTALLVFVFTYFTDRSADMGDVVLAANTILLQYFYWMAYGVDGFAFAAESVIGKYTGKKDKQGMLTGVKLCFVWGMGLAVVITLVYALFGQALLGVFTDQMSVIDAAEPYLFWMILMPLLATPCFIWDGVFIGLTASKALRNSMLVAVVFFLLVYQLIAPGMGNHGLWLAMCIFMVVRGFLQLGMWPGLLKNWDAQQTIAES